MPGTRRTARATCEKRAPLCFAPTQWSSAARESGSARASAASKMSDGSRGGGVGVLVDRARQPVGSAQVGGALPVGDHWALGRQDCPVGSRGGEDLRSIPVAALADWHRRLARVARGDVTEAPARGLHRLEEVPENARHEHLREHWEGDGRVRASARTS